MIALLQPRVKLADVVDDDDEDDLNSDENSVHSEDSGASLKEDVEKTVMLLKNTPDMKRKKLESRQQRRRIAKLAPEEGNEELKILNDAAGGKTDKVELDKADDARNESVSEEKSKINFSILHEKPTLEKPSSENNARRKSSLKFEQPESLNIEIEVPEPKNVELPLFDNKYLPTVLRIPPESQVFKSPAKEKSSIATKSHKKKEKFKAIMKR